jgi:phage terminase large subunit GpA-like protein
VLIISLTLVVKFDGEFAFACGSSPASVAALNVASDAAHDRRGHVACGHCGTISDVGRDGCLTPMRLRVPINPIFEQNSRPSI